MTRSASPSAARSPASPRSRRRTTRVSFTSAKRIDERRERAERVDVVGAASSTARRKRGADARTLDHQHRHDEADEGEPGHRGQHEEERRKAAGSEDDRADDDGACTSPPAEGRTPPTIAEAPVKDAAISGDAGREHEDLDERGRARP